MHRTVAALIAVIVLVPAPAALSLPRGTRVQTYKSGLAFPVDMAWVNGTRKVFFTEKNSGKVRVLIGRRLLDRACVNLDVNASGERGGLGIVLHPNFKNNHWLYVYYTKASPLENRVKRFTVQNNRCRNPRNIVTGLDASSSGYHNGGQLEFIGNKLFVSVGDAHDSTNSQNTSNRLGKILRLDARGNIPAGNPFGNAVWAYGLRNPFGLTHKPGSKKLFATDNGPQCDDEFNRIRKGRNYGWGPGYTCGTAGVGLEARGPLFRWSSPIAVTDPWWYKGRMRRLRGDVYVGGCNDGKLRRLLINSRGTRVRRARVIFDDSNCITDVSKGPGGWLYFLTSSAIKRIVRD
jgi:glucose/arabinose dehydrogenase